MKAFYFAKPLEHRLETVGEDYAQGDEIQGTLTTVNRAAAEHGPLTLKVGLAHALYKQLKESPADALSISQSIPLAADVVLKPGQETSHSWILRLPPDCPISTKLGGPFLVYGAAGDLGKAGKIDLPVRLAPALEAFVETVENHFAFVAKGRTTLEDFTEVAFKPPDSYPTLTEFAVSMRLGPDQVELRFRAKRKRLSGAAAGGLRTTRDQLSRTVPLDTFMMRGSLPNRPFYRELLAGIIAELAPPILGG